MYTRVVSVLCMLTFVPCAWPQSSTGQVSGTVRDQSGAVIPSANVALTNTATGVISTAQTNDVGFYLYPAVVVGPYRLAVEAAGMKKYEATFTVSVRQSVVIDPALEVGQTATEVEVRAVTPMVTVDSPALRQGMERERIEQLPLNGRSVATLVGLLPGFEGNRTFGAPNYSQEYILDGTTETGRRWGGLDRTPSLDSIQEFAVESNAISSSSAAL